MLKRRYRIFVTVLVVIAFIAAAIYCISPERRTLHYYQAHKDVLMKDITENEKPTCSLDLTFNYWDGEHPIMEYIVKSRGIVPSSSYYGLFYSYDGQPVSFQNSGAQLIPVSENVWEWHGAGDNHGLVKWIEENWFYFEASF